MKEFKIVKKMKNQSLTFSLIGSVFLQSNPIIAGGLDSHQSQTQASNDLNLAIERQQATQQHRQDQQQINRQTQKRLPGSRIQSQNSETRYQTYQRRYHKPRQQIQRQRATSRTQQIYSSSIRPNHIQFNSNQNPRTTTYQNSNRHYNSRVILKNTQQKPFQVHQSTTTRISKQKLQQITHTTTTHIQNNVNGRYMKLKNKINSGISFDVILDEHGQHSHLNIRH